MLLLLTLIGTKKTLKRAQKKCWVDQTKKESTYSKYNNSSMALALETKLYVLNENNFLNWCQ